MQNENSISKSRLEVFDKIKTYETLGGEYFFKDVENDPPAKILKPEDVDYLDRKILNCLKNKIARFIGKKLRSKTGKENQIEVKGTQNLKDVKGPAIITSNHFAHFESACASKVVKELNKRKRLYIVIREGNYSLPGMFGFLFRHCDTLPLSSNIHTMKNFNEALTKVLKKGHYVLVYPEQSMWWNYRKPRPQRTGAAHFACKNNVPIIPCFVTMQDLDKLDNDGLPVQKYTIHIMKPIYQDCNKTLKENVETMTELNYELCKSKYEEVYGIKLTYKADENEEVL